MRRALLVALAVALVAASPAAGALRLRADVTECTTGATLRDRVAAFTGAMPALPGTERMAMRFDLFDRERRVRAAGLGTWERSEPGRAGFVFTKRVEALAAPAAYRARVLFRWYDAEGRVQRRAERRTAVCRQPDPRPQLRVLAVSPGRVLVANLGIGRAGAFGTAVAVGEEPPPVVRLAGGLAAGAVAELALAEPVCVPGATVRAVVDVAGEVDERDERDNAVTLPCGL
jgi:hypothetical protein